MMGARGGRCTHALPRAGAVLHDATDAPQAVAHDLDGAIIAVAQAGELADERGLHGSGWRRSKERIRILRAQTKSEDQNEGLSLLQAAYDWR